MKVRLDRILRERVQVELPPDAIERKIEERFPILVKQAVCLSRTPPASGENAQSSPFSSDSRDAGLYECGEIVGAVTVLSAHTREDAQFAIFVRVVAEHEMPDVMQMSVSVVNEVGLLGTMCRVL